MDLQVTIRRIRHETPEIRSFVLEAKPGQSLPPYEAGAHIDVCPAPGLVRQYSLAGDPADPSRYLIAVKREQNGRGGSDAMHRQLVEGGTVDISLPKNNFGLRKNAGRSLILAGGIGVTPLLSMAQVLARAGSPFDFHYFARSDGDVAFREFIAASEWSSRVTYQLGLVPPRLNDVLDEILARPGPGDIIYLCGPGPFMDLVQTTAKKAGWQVDAVILEHFSADPPKLSLAADEFVVRLAKAGVELVVPRGKAIIEVLREAGIEIQTSCEQGVCGTCVTPVLEGEPDHNDLCLTEEDHGSGRLFTPCVSRSKSKLLVLDL